LWPSRLVQPQPGWLIALGSKWVSLGTEGGLGQS
jgi:hypothetical protein